MAVLSDMDIFRELGKNLLIHPIKGTNIKGSSINLTASHLAWRVSDGKLSLDSSGKLIIIPQQDTVLIETEESIYVSNKLCGTYHSKCKLVSKGLGHIGTTLDPLFIGPSLIAIHNHTLFEKVIEVGESFVTLTLYYLNSKSYKINTNEPGQTPYLKGFESTSENDNWLDEESRKDPHKLKKEMMDSEEYKKIMEIYHKNIHFKELFKTKIFHILLMLMIFAMSFLIYKYFLVDYFATKSWDFFIGFWFPIIIFSIMNSVKNNKNN